MTEPTIKIKWPNGNYSFVPAGSDWLNVANIAGYSIPTGCLTGSCGACEIEVNGKVIRACISTIPHNQSKTLQVEFASDPYW